MRKKIKNNSSKKTLARFMGWYIAVLTVVIMMSILVNHWLFGVLQKNTVDNSAAMARHLVDKLDSQLADIRSYALNLSLNVHLKRYLYTTGLDNSNLNIMALADLNKALPKWNTGSNMIEKVQIYLSNIDGFVDTDSACIRLATMYNKIYGRGDMDLTEWRDTYLFKRYYGQMTPAAMMRVGDSIEPRLLLIQSILGDTQQMLGQVLIYIPVSAIEQELQALFDVGVSVVTLYGKDGSKLVTLEKQGALPSSVQEDWLVNDFHSLLYGIHCITSMSRSVIDKQVENVRRDMNLYTVCIALNGLAIGATVAMRNAKPYVQLLGRLQGRETTKTGISHIDEVVDKLFSRQQDMENLVRQQRKQLETALYYRLVHGSVSADDLEALQRFSCHDLEADSYLGVLMDILPEERETRMHRMSTAIEEVLERMGTPIGFHVALSEKRIAILYLLKYGKSVKDAVHTFTTLYEELLEYCALSTHYFIGQETADLQQVHRSFQQATQLADYTVPENVEYIVSYSHSNFSATQSHNYSPAKASELENLLRAGNEAEACALLERIRMENAELSAFQTKLLLSALTDTFLRVTTETFARTEDTALRMETEHLLISVPDSSQEVGFAGLITCVPLLCKQIISHKKSRKHALAMEIRAYIQAYFREDSICLQSVSLAFGINERYLSTFFKEQTGESFQTYVTRLRIEEANRLLRETDLSIQAIAEQVGYVNPNTFRSAYNRVMGFNPSKYERRF